MAARTESETPIMRGAVWFDRNPMTAAAADLDYIRSQNGTPDAAWLRAHYPELGPDDRRTLLAQ